MDWVTAVSVGGLILGTSIVSLSYERTFAFDHTTQSSVFILILTGICLDQLDRRCPAFLDPNPANVAGLKSESSADSPESIALVRDELYEEDSLVERHGVSTFAGPRSWSTTALATAALVLRVGFLQWMVTDVGCATSGVEALLPIILALDAGWRSNRPQPSPDEPTNDNTNWRVIWKSLTSGGFRYVLPAILLGAAFVIELGPSPARSTYICSPSTRLRTQALQLLGVMLEYFILSTFASIVKSTSGHVNRSARSSLGTVAGIMLAAGTLLQPLSFIIYIVGNDRRVWMDDVTWTYMTSVFWSSLVLAGTTVVALRSLSHMNPFLVTFPIFATMTYVLGLSSAWADRHAFPPLRPGTMILSTAILCAAVAILLSIKMASSPSSGLGSISTKRERHGFGRIPWWSWPLLGLSLLRVMIDVSKNDRMMRHPIDVLIADARTQHNRYVKQAAVGKTLESAVDIYRRRYQRHPPPGFDKWFDYATSRGSLVLDDFDGIYEDLLPFWALKPAEIRARTWEMTSNPWNEISGISIRNGKAEPGRNTLPTHRWMLEGVAIIINTFAVHLPDMDIAMNLNDECRSAVPYDALQRMRKIGQDAGGLQDAKSSSFSPSRSRDWKDIPPEPITDTRFEDLSFGDTFYTYAAPTCPPRSKARTTRLWDTRGLCASCIAPHSLGPFIKDWTLAASVCHQPDLANLHGFFLSPAAFKSTHDLMPVFSQSKVHGYNDILYPSAWNYVDKVTYTPTPEHPDPAFRDKAATLFWRGATSEGVSTHGTWKGMTRQRLIHLAHNLTDADRIPLLLPTGSDPSSTYTYRSISPSLLANLTSPALSIYTVDKIARCGGSDCPIQTAELAFAPATNFQHHWSYKYLFDMDGAGFSGRFLPFLQSRSLPFKAALFREWYDGRLSAWLHFVPVDGRLHGLWSTLAYFAGLRGGRGGWDVVAHEREARAIAEEGRNWAGKVVRKEDMEIYFFRLLLEWGRMTDDRRDTIGFEL